MIYGVQFQELMSNIKSNVFIIAETIFYTLKFGLLQMKRVGKKWTRFKKKKKN